MKKKILSAALSVALALASHATQVDEKATLQQLLAENKNLTIQLDAAKKTEGQIAKAGLALEGAQSALKRAQQAVRQSSIGLIDEAKGIQQQAKQAGCPWGGSSTDKGFVQACNAEGTRLAELWKEVQQRGGGIQEYSQKLDERQNSLSNDTLKWAKKKQSNIQDLDILQVAQADWQRRYNAFVFRSEAYERLKKTAPAATLCATLPDGASHEHLRKAAHCLERLWDGRYRGIASTPSTI